MKTTLILGAGLILTAAAITLGPRLVQATSTQSPGSPPALPEVELPISLTHVQAFELDQPAQHMWQAEHPSYTKGLLVVLELDPAYLAPRQTAEPVLYVGNRTLERINTGYPSGELVGIVPDMTLEQLADAPIFLGQPALPEQVDAGVIAAELEGALASGLRGVGAERVAAVTPRVGASIEALDLRDLYYQASFLIETYAAQEADLIEGLRVERVAFE